MADVELVDLDGMRVFLTCGGVVPIVSCFDADGEECGAEYAVSVVAGPWTDAHYWLAIELSGSDEAVFH